MLPGAVSARYRLAQDASPVPLHLERCDRVDGCVLTSDVQPRKGKPGQSFRSSCVSRPVVAEGDLGHDRRLDALLSLPGRSLGSLAFMVEFCCVPQRRLGPSVPQTP